MKLYRIKWPGAKPERIRLDRNDGPLKDIRIGGYSPGSKKAIVPIKGTGDEVQVKQTPRGPIIVRGDRDPEDRRCLVEIYTSSLYSGGSEYNLYDAKGVTEVVRGSEIYGDGEEAWGGPAFLAIINLEAEFKLRDRSGVFLYRWGSNVWGLDVWTMAIGCAEGLAPMDIYEIPWPGEQPKQFPLDWGAGTNMCPNDWDADDESRDFIVGNESSGQATVNLLLAGQRLQPKVTFDGVAVNSGEAEPKDGRCLAVICAGETIHFDDYKGLKRVMWQFYDYDAEWGPTTDPSIRVILAIVEPGAKFTLQNYLGDTRYGWNGDKWTMETLKSES